jgi:hypothetical protein
MDWPGAQELAERLAKTIDPKLLSADDEDPALQAAQQQIQAMGQEMEGMHQMLQNVSKSMEAQEMERKDFEAQIKLFDAETKRLTAVQASMSPEQIQDIVLGTLHAAMDNGDIITEMQRSTAIDMQEEPQMEQAMPPQGMPPEQMPPQGMPPEQMPPQGMPQ